MKRNRIILFCVGFALLFLWPRTSSAQMDELEACVSSVTQKWNTSNQRIPVGWLDWDRGLWAMGQEVQALNENLAHLKKLQNPAAPSSVDVLLIENAVEFCRGFERQLSTRLQKFFVFALCFIALAIVLSVDFVLIMFSTEENPKASLSDR